jgi:hypothetical protein
MRGHDNPLSDADLDQLLRDTLNNADNQSDQLSPFLMDKIKGFTTLPQEPQPKSWYAELGGLLWPSTKSSILRPSMAGIVSLCLIIVVLGYSGILPNRMSADPQSETANLTASRTINGEELPESGFEDGDYWPSWSNLAQDGEIS